jgi:hypothetical protein
MPREIARYRAVEPLTLRTPDRRPAREVHPGEVVYFDCLPGAALLPLNAAARQNKLRAILAGRSRAVDPVRLARSLGFTGHDPAAAKAHIEDFVSLETSRSTSHTLKENDDA